MPRLGRCVARAFVHVAKKRYYLGAYNDPAVRELYARLTRVWDRTGHIDLSLIHEALIDAWPDLPEPVRAGIVTHL